MINTNINQPTLNIGTIGHVAHGKSTLVQSLTGIKTMKHSKEQELSLTIKLGYANFKIYKCDKCPDPKCYYNISSSILEPELDCPYENCDGTIKQIRHYSFIDCPGHDSFMGTMLTGSSSMDAVILIIAANESVPQKQTAEHLVVIDILGIKNIIILQNKVDLVSKETAIKNYNEILKFVKGTIAENKPIIPVSCIHKYNLDIVLKYLSQLQEPDRKINSSPIFNTIRSFDINSCGTYIDDITGGVIGGTLLCGKLEIGQEIEIKPGLITKDETKPLRAIIKSLYSEKNPLKYATGGGLIAIGTTLDPNLSKNDRLQGQVIGLPNTLPEVLTKIKIKYHLMKYLVGDKENKKINKISSNEKLKINCGAFSTMCITNVIEKNIIELMLDKPICLIKNFYVALSRQSNRSWRLIGYGIPI